MDRWWAWMDMGRVVRDKRLLMEIGGVVVGIWHRY